MNTSKLLTFTYYRGRVALFALLKALGVTPGDAVATQAFTCLAVPEGILSTGARPQYIDIEAAGFNMDPGDLARKITPQTRALVVQHTFGIPAQMTAIMEVANHFGLPVIEDCCHTLCSTYQGRRTGEFGVAGFYSFEWGKPIVAGLGGSAVAHDDSLRQTLAQSYDQLQSPPAVAEWRLNLQACVHDLFYRPRFYWGLRRAFQLLSKWRIAQSNYHAVPSGMDPAPDFRLRMSGTRSRKLRRRLDSAEQRAAYSCQIAQHFRDKISHPNVQHPDAPSHSHAVYARYPLRVRDKQSLLARARQANIELADWYRTPVHPLLVDESAAVQYEPESCPQAERRAHEVVSLPTHQRVDSRFVARACEFLNRTA